MISMGSHTKVFLATGVTDMRKSIDGLSVLVVDELAADLLSSHLFVFCNRLRDCHALYPGRNGQSKSPRTLGLPELPVR